MDTAAPSVSVAMGTHNGAAYLTEQLESILAQSRPPIEIVLSDDASSDGTAELAQRIVGARVPLRILRNDPALGVTANFEQAATATIGDLIALSDQDDAWAPTRLEQVAAQFAARPSLTLLHGDARLVDAAGAPLGDTLFGALEVTPDERELVHSGHAFDALLRRNLVTGATTVFRRELLERAAPFPREWVHDEWLAIIAATTGEVDLLESTLVDYRQHGGNQIGATRLGLAAKFGRLAEPRRARNERLAVNFGILEQRLEQLDVPSDRLQKAREKAEHERFRRALPEVPLLRIGPVVRQVLRGRYRQYSRARADILRDLVQPVD